MPPVLKRRIQPKKRCTFNAGDDDRRCSGSNSDEKRQLVNSDDNDGIVTVRQELILDFKTEADRMKKAILNNEDEEEEEAVKRWSQRKRRTNCKSEKGLKVDDAVRLPKLRSGSHKTQEKVKLSVQLFKNEIEEDFMKMLGRKPSARPKKRPKHVQKQLDKLYPGLWLAEITVDSYKVLEAAENGKKFRGFRRKKI